MSWIDLDDGILDHPKFIRAVKLADSYAIHLWLGIRAYCAKLLTDGFIDEDMIDEVRGPRDQKRRGAALKALIDVGLIDRVERGYAMHDYLDWSKSRAKIEEERNHGAVRAALRSNPKLMQAIRDRDRNCCRYCGRAVDWRDRRGHAGGTYDHVVPIGRGGGADLDNVVVACRQCAASKHDRLLSEWGRQLLPVGNQVTTSSDSQKILVSRARPPGEGSGEEGRGSGSPAPEGVQGEPIRLDPIEPERRRWTAEEWFEGFRLAWATYSGTASYGGRPNDWRGVGDLREILRKLSADDALRAQARAQEIYAAFFTDPGAELASAGYPWAWFVQRFEGLRVPRVVPRSSAGRSRTEDNLQNLADWQPPGAKTA